MNNFNQIKKAYGAYNNKEDVLLKSSSGGVVHELCSYVLNNGGAICSAVYDYSSHTLSHRLITDLAEIDRIKGSKYIQSSLNDVYGEMAEFLQSNPSSPFLFIGTPCQCDGVKNYLSKKNYSFDNIFFVDIICHGVGSNQIWSEYIQDLENSIGSKINYVTFKDKRRGWLLPSPIAKDENGNEHSIQNFLTLYNKHIIMRKACYNCHYAQLNRIGDITVGDYWKVRENNPDFYNENGVSTIFVNSHNGEKLFDNIRNEMNVIEVSVDASLQPNLQKPTSVNQKLYDGFWADYNKRGLKFIIKKYASTKTFDKLVRKILVSLKIWRV